MTLLQEVVEEAFAAYGDDLTTIKATLRARANGDREVRQALIDFAVTELVGREWRSGRTPRLAASETTVDSPRVTAGPTTPSAALMAGMKAHVTVTKQRLMDYEMPGGKRLGDCVRDEIVKAAGRMSKQGNTMLQRSEWLRGVAGLLPDNKRVLKAVLKEADLRRIQKRVERSEAA